MDDTVSEEANDGLQEVYRLFKKLRSMKATDGLPNEVREQLGQLSALKAQHHMPDVVLSAYGELLAQARASTDGTGRRRRIIEELLNSISAALAHVRRTLSGDEAAAASQSLVQGDTQLLHWRQQSAADTATATLPVPPQLRDQVQRNRSFAASRAVLHALMRAMKFNGLKDEPLNHLWLDGDKVSVLQRPTEARPNLDFLTAVAVIMVCAEQVEIEETISTSDLSYGVEAILGYKPKGDRLPKGLARVRGLSGLTNLALGIENAAKCTLHYMSRDGNLRSVVVPGSTDLQVHREFYRSLLGDMEPLTHLLGVEKDGQVKPLKKGGWIKPGNGVLAFNGTGTHGGLASLRAGVDEHQPLVVAVMHDFDASGLAADATVRCGPAEYPEFAVRRAHVLCMHKWLSEAGMLSKAKVKLRGSNAKARLRNLARYLDGKGERDIADRARLLLSEGITIKFYTVYMAMHGSTRFVKKLDAKLAELARRKQRAAVVG